VQASGGGLGNVYCSDCSTVSSRAKSWKKCLFECATSGPLLAREGLLFQLRGKVLSRLQRVTAEIGDWESSMNAGSSSASSSSGRIK